MIIYNKKFKNFSWNDKKINKKLPKSFKDLGSKSSELLFKD